MAKIGFNPFDDAHRDKRPRRRSEDVAAQKRDRNAKIDSEILSILDNYNNIDYINVSAFLENSIYLSEYSTIIRRNLNTAMGRLGYVKMMAKTSDGRWKIEGVNTFVYKKVDKPDLTKDQLKQYFE